MILLPDPLRDALQTNAATPDADACPVLKLFSPAGPQTWLATELADDGDSLFGLADLGFGCPELGYFSLRAIVNLRLPYGLRIERDIVFETPFPLSVWVDVARAHGSIMAAETALARRPLPPSSDPELPPNA